MKLETEPFINRGVDTNPPLRWNPIDTSGDSSATVGKERKRRENLLREVRFNIQQEDKGERRKEENSQEKKTDGFEPFVDSNDPLKPPINKEGDLFINFYGGNYAQKMELNRKGIERVLTIAHLGGQVFLTSLSPNRQRSIEANPDGSVSAKRNLLLQEKIEEDDKKNPLYRVIPVPQGWRIEVNDQKLTEELTEKEKLTGKELQRAFVRRFNGVLKKGLFECVWREKLSSVKDEKFCHKRTFSLICLSGGFLSLAIMTLVDTTIPIVVSVAFSVGSFFVYNSHTNLITKHRVDNPNFIASEIYRTRNIDHPLEILMPQVEVDKVARAFTHLQVKGRRLVREVKE